MQKRTQNDAPKRTRIRYTTVRVPVALARRIDAALALDESIRSRNDWVRITAMRRLEELEVP